MAETNRMPAALDLTQASSDPLPEFEQLLHAQQSMVYSLALRYLGDSGLAEEVAQDVFLRLHQEYDRLASRQHAIAWLRRVTVHRAIDAGRQRRAARLVDLDHAPEGRAPSPSNDLLLHARLQRMVASLPEKQRIAVILRYQEDLAPEEIAGVLGAPLATVKSHLRRGLAMLREKAESLWGGPA